MKFVVIIFTITNLFILITADPKMKKPPPPLTGLYAMKYMPMVPYNILGMNHLLVHGPSFRPNPRVIKESPKAELPAPYVPSYGNMETLMGYGGLPMPYGGYGYPFLNGYQ